MHYVNNTRRQARLLYKDALRKRLLIPVDKCEICNSSGEIETLSGHHYKGYNYPLDVQWLCRTCHGRIHSSLKDRMIVQEGKDLQKIKTLPKYEKKTRKNKIRRNPLQGHENCDDTCLIRKYLLV